MSRLIKLTQRLHCLLYAFLSISLFVFKNLFLSRDLFMISLFIVLFMKGAWFARTYCCFIGAWFRIASLSTIWKCQTQCRCFQRHLRYCILNISHKYLIRKIVIAAACDNCWLFFLCRILSLTLMSFYENLTTMFLMSQNLESILVCLLL